MRGAGRRCCSHWGWAGLGTAGGRGVQARLLGPAAGRPPAPCFEPGCRRQRGRRGREPAWQATLGAQRLPCGRPRPLILHAALRLQRPLAWLTTVSSDQLQRLQVSCRVAPAFWRGGLPHLAKPNSSTEGGGSRQGALYPAPPAAGSLTSTHPSHSIARHTTFHLVDPRACWRAPRVARPCLGVFRLGPTLQLGSALSAARVLARRSRTLVSYSLASGLGGRAAAGAGASPKQRRCAACFAAARPPTAAARPSLAVAAMPACTRLCLLLAAAAALSAPRGAAAGASLAAAAAAAGAAQGASPPPSLAIPRIIHTYFMNGEEVCCLCVCACQRGGLSCVCVRAAGTACSGREVCRVFAASRRACALEQSDKPVGYPLLPWLATPRRTPHRRRPSQRWSGALTLPGRRSGARAAR